MVLHIIDNLGHFFLTVCNYCGLFVFFLMRTIRTLYSTPLKIKKVIEHMERIGVASLPVIILTGTSTGMVLAFQSYIGFHRFGAEEFLGTIIALSMARELGPILTGLMVTGRAGSAIAAEIGTMEITEQIDALRTLGINPYQYLVVPRIIAGILVVPLLSLFCTICGIIGGYIISVHVLELNSELYIKSIQEYLVVEDILGGLIKSSVFGFILTWVGTYKGYTTAGGARGVGLSTTQSVVFGSIGILIANYFLTAILF